MIKLRTVGQWLRKKSLLLMGAVVIASSSAAVAMAAIPDAGGVIHGCYSKLGGGLRVIDSASAACRATENGLNWNQQGQSGGSTGGSIGLISSVGRDQVRTFQIPNLGEFSLSCIVNSSGTTNASVTYRNTTSTPVFYNLGPDSMTPGSETVLPLTSSGRITADVLVATAEGANQHGAKIELTDRPRTLTSPDDGCDISYTQIVLK